MPSFDAWETELYHHGIKGMVWGRRRWQNEDGSLTEAGKQRYGTAENYNRLTNKKKVKYMTDDELKAHIARRELEDKYRSLNRGESVIKTLSNYMDKAAERKNEREKRELRQEELRTQQVQAIQATKKAREESIKAKREARKAKQERKIWQSEAKTKLARKEFSDARARNTIRGGIAKWLNRKFNTVHTLKPSKRREQEAERAFKTATLNQKIKDIKEFGSLTEKDIEERAVARANRRRRHIKQ